MDAARGCILKWGASALCCTAAGVWAQSIKPAGYPSKPVRIIVGFAAGGATDIVGRIVAQKLVEASGGSFIVENRPGASATIAAEQVAKSPPDGYTLMIAATTSHSVMPGLTKLAYDPTRDFGPISQLATSPLLLGMHPSLPVRSIGDLIKLAKARPGQLSFGAGGTGTPPHMAGELFRQMAGVDLLYVPYKGEAPAISDMIGGQISMVFGNVISVIPHVKSARLRGVAVTSPQRITTLAEFPTIAESGLPGFVVESWYGLVGPAGMPADVVAKLNADLVRALNQPDVKSRLLDQGLFVQSSTPEALSALLRTELAKWAKVIKAAGTKLE